MQVTFVLPGAGGGGGAHSVVQETLGLHRLGVQVSVAASQGHHGAILTTYPELEHHGIPVPIFKNAADLANAIGKSDIAIATTAPSAMLLSQSLEQMEASARPRAAYYVQDYEPLFFTPGTPEWQASRNSYTCLPDALLFAKTNWLVDVVHANHGKTVRKVKPSIDHATFYPRARQAGKVTRICAMLRPKTARRAPRRTARILENIARSFGSNVEIATFGCAPDDLLEVGLRLSPRIEHRGVLRRQGVASVLRTSDLFLDLSDFQAFGRTGLEGMACGCVPVLPVFGGAGEYAVHYKNAFVVDTRDDEAIMKVVDAFVSGGADLRARMRKAAIETSLEYSIEKAAFSEYEIFTECLGLHV